jgi:hypothetical protein
MGKERGKEQHQQQLLGACPWHNCKNVQNKPRCPHRGGSLCAAARANEGVQLTGRAVTRRVCVVVCIFVQYTPATPTLALTHTHTHAAALYYWARALHRPTPNTPCEAKGLAGPWGVPRTRPRQALPLVLLSTAAIEIHAVQFHVLLLLTFNTATPCITASRPTAATVPATRLALQSITVATTTTTRRARLLLLPQ